MADFQKTDILQAVLLADSYTVRLRPVTNEKPKVLLPLVNVPMLDYALEFLAAGGVREIFVVSFAHHAQVEAYLRASKWNRMQPSLVVHPLSGEDCDNAGAALRMLDQRHVISGHFVLISGDVISNIALDKVLQAHKDRAKTDKRNIMTVVFKKADQNHRTRALDDDTVVGVNGESGELLIYDNNVRDSRIVFGRDLIDTHGAVQVRYDLMDTHIDICSPEILHLFTHNFDWVDLRSDCIRGVLFDEVLGHKIFTHVIQGEYAARVKDLRTYDSISKDIILRWTSPMVPDNNLLGDGTSYRFNRRNIYIEEHNVSVARTAELVEDVVVGAGSRIGAGTRITQSVVGRHCKIGKNCRLRGAYLWDNCVVGDNVTIEKALLCNRVVLGDSVTIGAGTLLSFNVHIGPNHVVPKYSKITALARPTEEDDGFGNDPLEEELTPALLAVTDTIQDTDSDSDSTPPAEPRATLQESDPTIVGADGVGRLYQSGEELSESESDAEERDPRFAHLNSFAPPPAALLLSVHPDEVDEDDVASAGEEADNDDDARQAEEEALLAAITGPTSRASSFKRTTKTDDFPFFLRELSETMRRGETQGLDWDGVLLEISALKLAHDATVQDFAMAIVLGLFGLADIGTPLRRAGMGAASGAASGAVASKAQVMTFMKLLARWKDALVKFSGSESDQQLMIAGLENGCLEDVATYKMLLPMMLQYLYNEDVFSEDAILGWADARAALRDAGDLSSSEVDLYALAEKFVTWMREAEEEDSDEEEDEEDED